MSDNLKSLREKLLSIAPQFTEEDYFIPELWLNNEIEDPSLISVNPILFFQNRLKKIDELSKSKKLIPVDRSTLGNAIVYNMLVRHTLAFDNNLDGDINPDVKNIEWRETGTFLKAIALLPYLHSLGVNIIYLLPITKISEYGNKGNLGSPYAIKNHYKIEDKLAEPNISNNPDYQFAAFVEAAHKLGIKVILEFVFRTAGLDSDMIFEHPDWFYWIYKEYADRGAFKPPFFDEDTLSIIKQKIESNDLSNLPKPNDDYISMFAPTPEKISIVDSRIIGYDTNGKECVIPSAFADWPPDDNQPLWSDVTYLKLFEHTDFNYMAYNTIRMYDEELNQEKYRKEELWNYLSEIIPFYIQKFGIDGVMIDMGHALPKELREMIVSKARDNNPDFILWEENFSISKESKDNGYDASLGYVPFDIQVWWKMKELIRRFALDDVPIHFFAAPETHNTHRLAQIEDKKFSDMMIFLNYLMPTIKFFHSGIELNEKLPVNTGLGFTEKEILQYPVDVLPLFSTSHLNWLSKENSINLIRHLNTIHEKYLSNNKNLKVEIIDTPDELIGFKIINDKNILYVFANYNKSNDFEFLTDTKIKELIINGKYKIEENKLSIKTEKYNFYLFISENLSKLNKE